MMPSPRVAAVLALLVFGFPLFLIGGVAAAVLDMPWIAFVVWLALGVAFALIGALPRDWPEGWDEEKGKGSSHKPRDAP